MSISFFPSHLPLCFRPLALGVVALAVSTMGALTPLQAAKAERERGREPRDSAPVLMSRTGGAGGDMWADVKELEQAAKKGNPRAETQLGEMLLRGDGIPKDETRGIALLEKAARAGQAPAAFRIGMLLANGENSVANDPARALEYFRAAAAGGEAEAFFNIGAAYASARGVKRNYAEALGWLLVAQKRGAQSNAADALRNQIKSRPDWIATGERRAKEIEAEFADKKLVDLLPPPAPLDKPFDPLRPKVSSSEILAPDSWLLTPRPEVEWLVPKPLSGRMTCRLEFTNPARWGQRAPPSRMPDRANGNSDPKFWLLTPGS